MLAKSCRWKRPNKVRFYSREVNPLSRKWRARVYELRRLRCLIVLYKGTSVCVESLKAKAGRLIDWPTSRFACGKNCVSLSGNLPDRPLCSRIICSRRLKRTAMAAAFACVASFYGGYLASTCPSFQACMLTTVLFTSPVA